jgi:CheY-like chemotaxis protein
MSSVSPSHSASVTPTHIPKEADVPPSLVTAPHADKSTPPITVLIAEDDPDLRDIFTIAFRYKQFDVRTVRNGEEAIDTLKAELPQVLVLDISMPKVSGIDVLRYIREQGWHSKMHCIVVTANPGYKLSLAQSCLCAPAGSGAPPGGADVPCRQVGTCLLPRGTPQWQGAVYSLSTRHWVAEPG